MNTKQKILAGIFMLVSTLSAAQQMKALHVKSPDGKIDMSLTGGTQLKWGVTQNSSSIIAPSKISLTLINNEILGENPVVTSSKYLSANNTIATPIYKKSVISDRYNELTVNFKGNYGLILRVYNDGAAYRFFLTRKGEVIIKNEEANFNFTNDDEAYIPYVRDIRNNDIYMSSFEALYHHIKLSAMNSDTLAFSPVLVDLGNDKKAAILEADLEDYPGMFLKGGGNDGYGLHSNFARYPLKEAAGGFQDMNYVVAQRADYIAKIAGTRSLPWRVVVITNSDKELANSDMVQKLASPNRIGDVSWIKPGKVAWDWWNDWNITKVDFKAGINNATYNYYADFASANKIQYIILDEGWSEQTDMMKIAPAIDLAQIIDHAKKKNVDVILWASWYVIDQNMDEAFAKYSKMGVKGFKIDFLDRDDQKMVASCYKIAQAAAKYHLLVDFHGMYKPTGLQRTYPNIINFEGVKGMENEKWTTDDVPGYDVTIPFIRMLAGPMDYTPGAMRNANKADFRPSNSNPMSQGTRCHQLAMYVVFEAPLAMMADNPTAYMKEQECTTFIAKVPTTFDETVVLDGKVGKHVAIARKKGDTWYLGAMSSWDACDLELDMSFLGSGRYEAEVFRDGINAGKDATDYKREVVEVSSKDKLKAILSNGGGWAAKIYPLKN